MHAYSLRRAGLLTLVLALIPAAHAADFGARSPAPTPVLEFRGGEDINEWLVTGPFDERSETPLIDKDVLRALGMGEAEPREIASLRDTWDETATVRTVIARGSKGLIDVQHALGRSYSNLEGITQSGAYLDCIIRSGSEQAIYLSVGNADAMKIWLNGNLVHRLDGIAGVETYSDCIRLKLQEGDNLLRAKVVNRRGGRGIAAHLEKQPYAAARAAMKEMRIRPGNLLRRVFVNARNPLVLGLVGVPDEFSCAATVLDISGKPVVELSAGEVNGKGWTPTLPPGVYFLRIVVGGENHEQPFCIGEGEEVYARLKADAQPYLDDTPGGLSMTGCIRRLEILFDPEVRPARFSYAWDRKILFPLANLATLIQTRKHGAQLGTLAGLQIRGFRSAIDGSIQFYRLYIPERASREGQRMPLVIFVPTITSANRPFIASPFMAAQSEAERIAALAEQYQMAVVWSGYRNQPAGLPIEYAHHEEVLADLGRLYAIDSGRMFLCGACGGGAVSAFYTLHRPGRYAGIGLLNPTFGLQSGLSQHFNFNTFPGFAQYNEECEMAPSLVSTTKGPMLLINDGAELGHGDLSVSQYFARLAHQNRYPLEFEIRAQPRQQHFDAWERFFEWFSAASPAAATPARPSSWREDTVLASLARPFVVAEGTGGNHKDAQRIRELSDRFQDAWGKLCHGPCKVVRDTELAGTSVPGSTLVLIGNPRTNSVWSRLGGDAPVLLGKKRIRALGQEWTGNSLSIVAQTPDPRTSGGTLVFMGAADLEDADFGELDVATEGWFSYAIFDKMDGVTRLIDAGRWPKPPAHAASPATGGAQPESATTSSPARR